MTLVDLALSANEKKALVAAKELLVARFPVEQVILFGSKARGDDDEESDIDLLLLTPKPIDWRERQEIVSALFDVGMQFDVIFSIMVVPSREWREGLHTVLPIHDEIDRDGVPL